MNKKILFSTLLSVSLLTACGDNAPEEGTLDSNEEVDNETETENENDVVDEENDLSDDETEASDNEDDESTEDSEDENAEEETSEFLYEVSENYAYINVLEEAEANDRVALLTFDDGPNEFTLGIADVLEEYDVSAIFFVNGHRLDAEDGEETLLELHERGFEIGNHSYTHANMTDLSEEDQYDEIIQTSDRIEEIIGERPRFWRAPFGANTEFSTQTALEDGMMLMNWTYGFDWEPEYIDNPDGLADIMVNTELLIPGSNLLMHDREWTLAATPAIIEGLQEQDYEILDPSYIQSVEEMDEEDIEEIEENESEDAE